MKISVFTKFIGIFFVLLIVSFGIIIYYKFKHKKEVLDFFGNVEIKEVNLAFETNGTIANTFFEEGDFVHKNDVMASLDPFSYGRSLQFAESTKLAIEADFKNAELNFLRNKNVYDAGYISDYEYENLKTIRDSLYYKLESQKKQVQIKKEDLDKTKLIAPSDGIVMTKVLENGSVVSFGQVVYTILLSNHIFVRGYVSEPSLGRISYGMPVIIITDGGDKYDGKISFISSKAEFTPKTVETEELRVDLVYRFKVLILNPNGKLKQGMPVTIKILKDSKNKIK